MKYLLLGLGLTNLLAGFLFIALNVPLAQGLVPMNRVYGVRIAKAYASPENWREINRYGGEVGIAWAVPIVLSGAGLIAAFLRGPALSPEAVRRWTMAGVVPLVLFALAPLIQIVLWSRRLPG